MGRCSFCNFLSRLASDRTYEDVEEALRPKLREVCDRHLKAYNDAKDPMNLVMFSDAISHLCRISRVISQPFGNLMLLGIGGSGRQSLSRLSAFIHSLKVFQVEVTKQYTITEWRDDMKRLLLQGGRDGNEIVFLLNDTQSVQEYYYEDMSNVLSHGEILPLQPRRARPHPHPAAAELPAETGTSSPLRSSASCSSDDAARRSVSSSR